MHTNSLLIEIKDFNSYHLKNETAKVPNLGKVV